jgi:4-methylaminobutanoate oxidase (formaldehyde-forming)
VSLFELSPFGKFEICGKDALKYLQNLCCSNIDIAEGRVQYSLMLNTRGGIEAEITVTRMAPDKFRIISGAATRFKDYHWLNRHGADYSDLIIRDVSEAYAVLGVMGPGSRALMEQLADADFGDADFPFSSARCIHIGNCELLAARLSFVGELGWELYIPLDRAKHVFDTIATTGAAHKLGYAGHFALDSCRLEKGYHHWGHDIGNEDSPFEAGLGFTVRFDKREEFIGKAALLEQKKLGWQKQLQLCEVLAEEVLILQDEPVYTSDRIVGHCTSGGLGFRTGKALCFVMFYDKDSVDGLALEIEIAGERHRLEILHQAPYQAAVK